jgi:hypothetical protein
MIDLHAHSTFSDGSLTPEELAQLAAETGLTAMALTDHDCTAGVPRFVAACASHGIQGIPGVEISADVKKGTLHMLGYFLDIGNETLEAVLVRIRQGREVRNREILEKLRRLKVDLTWEQVAAYAGEDVVGRPHFAQALMAGGYVKTKEDAFDRYLGKGKPAYANRFRLSPPDGIAAIQGAGGLAVLAHPFTLDLGREAMREMVAGLVASGLDGIEAHYSEHTQEQTEQYLALAREFNLVPTGGSDFHGGLNPAIRLGRGFGSLHVPEESLRELEQRRAWAAAAGRAELRWRGQDVLTFLRM